MVFFWKRLSSAALFAFAALCVLPAAAEGQSVTFTTFAGSGPGSDDGTGSAARFNSPLGVATDNSGNVYVADSGNHTIRKITAGGAVTTLAGLAGSQGSADGIGSAARFYFPDGVAADGSGNVYVADSGNHTIRKITPAGTAATLAGLAGSQGSADGIGSAARFNDPEGVATDSSGNVYVADAGNHTIRKITPAGAVTTLAGLPGSSGSADGTGSAARFANPFGVATDGSGTVYVADTNNNAIRKITSAGFVSTLAGLAGSQGSADGTGSTARFALPFAVATDSGGNVYVADSYNETIRKITPAGVVTTLAGLARNSGSADGTASAARFSDPEGLFTDAGGTVYVADAGNHTIRKITPAGAVTTLAGLAVGSGSADGPGTAARFSSPSGVATDSSRNVYVADAGNYTIRKITSAGVVTTLAGLAETFGSADGPGSTARFISPYGVATDNSGSLYVADTFNNTIRQVTPSGFVSTVAGLGGISGRGSADGPLSTARFSNPFGVATDSSGNVYVADTGNNTIRKITPQGFVTTLAGLAGSSGSADGTGITARFNSPVAAATDGSGNVYVADTNNHTIRKITPAGAVTTLAGLAGSSGSADGTGSAARFKGPRGVFADSSGTVYVADSGNNTIRIITSAGAVTTLAGLAGSLGAAADGTGSTARFANPSGVATDSSGNIYVADSGSNTIRLGRVALGDVAVIDVSTGVLGSTRRLDTSPQTATSWQWSVIRRPVDAVADLSSATVRNPTFTPDVPGLFTFRLIATGTGATSVTTVDLTSVAPGPRHRAARH
jgi:D-alanyl-D-alanine dipeptidase